MWQSLKAFIVLLISLLAGSLIYAQGGFTTVSGVIVDPNGIPWAGGTITAQLVTPGGTAPTLNGVSFTATNASGLLGPGGTFSFRLGDNGVILPPGTKWQFTVSISPGVLPPAGKGPQSFSVTTPINCGTNTPATCTANAIVITATLAPVPALAFAGGGTPGGSPGQIQFNNAGSFGGSPLAFTARSSTTCTLSPLDAPCDNFQFPTATNACFGGILSGDPPGETLFSNTAVLCDGPASEGGAAVFVDSISNASLITALAISGYGSTFGTTNGIAIGVSGTAGDDPADTGTGQTFLAGTFDLSLTRAAGTITDIEGIQVAITNANTGGAPAAETVGTEYGIHVKDMLAKGTTVTAALQIDAQTASAVAYAIKVDGGPSLFSGKLTTAAPTAASTGFNLPHGSAPTTPNNGDLWTTIGGLFVRINGVTQGPFSSGFANPMTTIGDMIGGAGGGAPTRIPGGKTGQSLLFTNAALPAAASPGLADGNAAAHVTTTPYVVACDSATAMLDRVTTIVFDAGSSVITAPDHTATGCGGNMPFTLINESGGTLTVNRGGADTFNVTGNVAKSIAATSFTIPDSGSAAMNNGEAGIWNVRVLQPNAGGATALSAITSATSSPAALTNGNFPQTWNWALTTDATDGMGFGDSVTPSTGGTLTNGLANQAVVAITGGANSTATPFEVVQGLITNTVATPAAQIETTWNNASLVGQGLMVSCTNTSSAAGSHCLNILSGAAGATSEFSVDPNGNVNIPVGSLTVTTGIVNVASLVRGTAASVGVTYQGGNDGGGATVGSGGFRGSDNTSVTVGAIGGTATLRGGDMTTGTANQTLGGILTIRGGNTPSTASNAAGGPVTITGGGLTGAATNVPGADVTIAGGLGTGNSTPAHVKIQMPCFISASGTTAQAECTRYTVHIKAGSLTSATATNIFNIALANNQTAGAHIVVHVETTDGTPNNCSTQDEFDVVAQDTAGTVTTNVSSAIGQATICSTGTLSIAAAASAAAPTVISVTPTWTVTTPTAVKITVEIENLSQQDVTLL
jgi:hypothetical protein